MRSLRSIRAAFNDIWDAHRELQNWSSSAWWFFLFLPKQKRGYGPKQMMFTYASRQGELVSVNKTWQKGFSLNRTITKEKDSFMTTVVGWINDGENVYEEIVHQPAMAHLFKKEQRLSAFNGKFGAEIRRSKSHDFGIDGKFIGKNGHAIFQAWTEVVYDDEDNIINEFELPQINEHLGPASGKLGNTSFVAWRKFQFTGEFKSPSGTEELDGIGYFQRVLMNIPMPPWKWVFAAFEDGSLFSSFMIAAGLHAFRRDYYFYRTGLERRVFHILPSAYYYNSHTHKVVSFNHATVEITTKNDDNPDFAFHVWNDDGDELYMMADTHNHAQFLLDRRSISFLWQSKFNYNEYMFEVTKIRGQVNGELFNQSTHGKLWGNIEYVFGWSL